MSYHEYLRKWAKVVSHQQIPNACFVKCGKDFLPSTNQYRILSKGTLMKEW